MDLVSFLLPSLGCLPVAPRICNVLFLYLLEFFCFNVLYRTRSFLCFRNFFLGFFWRILNFLILVLTVLSLFPFGFDFCEFCLEYLLQISLMGHFLQLSHHQNHHHHQDHLHHQIHQQQVLLSSAGILLPGTECFPDILKSFTSSSSSSLDSASSPTAIKCCPLIFMGSEPHLALGSQVVLFQSPKWNH